MPDERSREAQNATFAEVSPGPCRQPSWIAKQRGDVPPVALAPRAAPLPREFVAAFRQELDLYSEAPPAPDENPDQAPEATPAPPPGSAPPVPALPDPALVAGLIDAIEQLARARAEVLSATAGQLAELAAMIAQRVIAHELSVDAAVVDGLVREGLDALGEHDRVSVRLGPGFASAAAELEGRLALAGHRADVRIDSRLVGYGCVVETELGTVDESIESRLATLLQALKPDSAPPL